MKASIVSASRMRELERQPPRREVPQLREVRKRRNTCVALGAGQGASPRWRWSSSCDLLGREGGARLLHRGLSLLRRGDAAVGRVRAVEPDRRALGYACEDLWCQIEHEPAP